MNSNLTTVTGNNDVKYSKGMWVKSNTRTYSTNNRLPVGTQGTITAIRTSYDNSQTFLEVQWSGCNEKGYYLPYGFWENYNVEPYPPKKR